MSFLKNQSGAGRRLIYIGIFFLSLVLLFNEVTLKIVFSVTKIWVFINHSVLRIFDAILFLIAALSFVFYRNLQFYRVLRIILINLSILFFGLILIELFFGNWISSNRLNRLNIMKNYVHYYDASHLYKSDQTTIKYTRDEFGFRGQYPSVSQIDILTMGGSTTDQRYIADGKTWQDILQQEFKKNEKDVFIINAGIDGQSTYGHIKNFDWWFSYIPNLKVKYFLFFIGLNDFHKDSADIYDDLLGDKYLLVKIKIALKNRSAIYYLYRTLKGILEVKSKKIGHGSVSDFSTDNWTNTPLIQDHFTLLRNRLNAYEKRLAIVCEKVKSFGAQLIFVTQTKRSFYRLNNQIFGIRSVRHYDSVPYNGVDDYYMTQLFNQTTLKVCEKYGGIGIDLASDLHFDLQIDFYDISHTTPSGAEKIGKYLFTRLRNIF